MINKIGFQLLFILLISCSQCHSQAKGIPIEIDTNFFGKTFYYYGEVLPPHGVIYLLKNIPAAKPEYKIAKRNHITSTVFKIAGAASIVYSLEPFLRFTSQSPHWIFTAAGAAIISVSIPFSIKYTRHAVKAVNIYNDTIRNTKTEKSSVQLNFGCSDKSISLKLLF